MYLFIYYAVTPFFTYRIVSCMYNEYIVSIFRFLKYFCTIPNVLAQQYILMPFFGEQKFL
jgi:hypothetical protein